MYGPVRRCEFDKDSRPSHSSFTGAGSGTVAGVAWGSAGAGSGTVTGVARGSAGARSASVTGGRFAGIP